MRPLFLLMYCSLLLGGLTLVSAQSCLNYIAVDGVLLEGQAACYFGIEGNEDGAENAFIRTDQFTAALGLESAYDQETGMLRFRQGDRVVQIVATDDIEEALKARPDVLEVAGERRAGRSAILAASSYLPLTTLVEAFGGSTGWNNAASLIAVDFSSDNFGADNFGSDNDGADNDAGNDGDDAENNYLEDDRAESLTENPAETRPEDDAASGAELEVAAGEVTKINTSDSQLETATETSPDSAEIARAEIEGEAAEDEPDAARTQLGAPRHGVHNGYTRVALDLPPGLEYQLAVDGNNFVVLFSAARADPFQLSPESPQLASLGYAEAGDRLALIASTTYPLGVDGEGFEVGEVVGEVTGGDDAPGVLYIDFAPELRGERVAQLQDLPRTELATVRRPEHVRKTVVIDPGHGGKDPGAVSEYIVEKELALSVALKLEALLEARGIGVVMTRRDDRYMALEARSEFAVPSEHNLFISLHANSAESNRAHGIETWVFGQPQDDSLINLAILENGGGGLGRARTVQAQEDAASISGDLLREENLSFSTSFAEAVQDELIYATESENRGVKQNYFSVIRYARVPAVLVELGFINHPVEGPKLASDAYQALLAESLAQGIETFLNQGGTLAYRKSSSN